MDAIKHKAWERLKGNFVIAFAKTEGDHLTFDSIHETAKQAQVRYRELLKDESIFFVSVLSVITSMDKVVKFHMDNSRTTPEAVWDWIKRGDWSSKDGYKKEVGAHVRRITEEAERIEKKETGK